MSNPVKLSEELRDLRSKKWKESNLYVRDWKGMIPKESLWFPGSTGLSNCTLCKGLGWVRKDVPVGHPDFGKLFACECSKGKKF